jgi:cytochrome c553
LVVYGLMTVAIPPLAMAEASMVAKLEAYRDKRLPNPTMQTVAGRLTDAEIAALARYFAPPAARWQVLHSVAR